MMRFRQSSHSRASSSEAEIEHYEGHPNETPRQILQRPPNFTRNEAVPAQVHTQSLVSVLPSGEQYRLNQRDHYGSPSKLIHPVNTDHMVSRRDVSQEHLPGHRRHRRLPNIQQTPQMHRVGSSVVKNATPIYPASHYEHSQHLSHVLSAERSCDSIVKQTIYETKTGPPPSGRRMMTGEGAPTSSLPYATHSPMAMRKRKDSTLVGPGHCGESLIAPIAPV